MGNMPPVTKNLLIINVLFFAGSYASSLYGLELEDLLGLHFVLASNFHVYQLFTYMFMHHGFAHLFFNMFAVWMFGRIMEVTMGQRRFLLFYLLCGIGAGLTQEVAQYVHYVYSGLGEFSQVNLGYQVVSMSDYLDAWTTVGASGCVYGVLLSFGMSYPEERMFIIPIPVPIKAKYFVVGYAVIELLYATLGSSDGVAHVAHLGGMLFGLLLILYWRRSDRNGSSMGGVFDGIRRWFSGLGRRRDSRFKVNYGGKFGQEMEYRRRKKMEEEEMDRILDKVRKHGYGSLTEDEKRRIFRH
ncbi:MAG: rhomboid family intramembrane serine protease [Bacteroidaceae bacterium]